jgi:hypothetical protein
MRKPFSLAVALTLAGGALAASTAGGQAPPPPPPPVPPPPPPANPCQGPDAARLLCPNIVMSPPAHIYVTRSHGRLLVHAENAIDNHGAGPAELRGHRTGRSTMRAVQVIHVKHGKRLVMRTGAHLGFKAIPGQGHYWKFRYAARFELWRLDSHGNRVKLVRTGEKQYYCLRDLDHTKPHMPRSPHHRVYPGCNQSSRTRKVTLGTSVGWSDVYPSTYNEQYIDATGLRGRFMFVHRADPRNGIWESNEDDNASGTIVKLPSGRVLGHRGPFK